jgi:hypothetical protein
MVRVSLGVASGLVATVLGGRVEAMTLARDGVAQAPILLAQDAIPSEETAAAELAGYLERASGARFTVDGEPAAPPPRAIYLGPTERARASGMDCERLEPEAWRIRTSGDDLLLCGGRPRGTLYAVYHYLEDQLGVRWWTPFAEHVPKRPILTHGRIEASGRPVFAYRDISGVDGPRAFCARSRLNGDMTRLTWPYGGRIEYGPPWGAHNFYRYIPPERYFETHPEFFSERDGVRTAVGAQLCLTNPEVVRHVTERLRENIAEAQAAAAAEGRPAARLFYISQNDWGGACQCPRCQALASGEGESGVLVQFLNAVADRIRDDHPDVRLDTLAYHYTFPPPRTVRPRDTIIVRLSGLQRRDFSKSVLAPENREYREGVKAWSRIAPNLWIWDYSVTFGFADLPLPNLFHFARDCRFYRRHGVQGMFVQHEHPITADLRDLKLWVLAKLLEDPDRDPAQLVREFTDGFYGPAAGPIRSYLELLRRAASERPCFVRFEARPEEYRYLDLQFLVAASRMFDGARAAVAGDSVLLQRVHHARLSLDRAILFLWRRIVTEHLGSGRLSDPLPLDLEQVAERCRRTIHEQIELRVPEWRRTEERARLDGEVDLLRTIARRREALVRARAAEPRVDAPREADID